MCNTKKTREKFRKGKQSESALVGKEFTNWIGDSRLFVVHGRGLCVHTHRTEYSLVEFRMTEY